MPATFTHCKIGEVKKMEGVLTLHSHGLCYEVVDEGNIQNITHSFTLYEQIYNITVECYMLTIFAERVHIQIKHASHLDARNTKTQLEGMTLRNIPIYYTQRMRRNNA